MYNLRSISFVFLLHLLLPVCLFGQQTIPEIKVDPKDQPKGTLTLSDIAASIEYLPLQTKDECLLGSFTFLDISDNYIVIDNKQSNNVLLFSRNGKFICKVGNYGQGPEDFLFVGGIFIDETNKCIGIDTSPHFLKFYNFKGKFMAATPPKSITAAIILDFYKDKYLLFEPLNEKNNPLFAYEIRTTDYKVVAQYGKSIVIPYHHPTGMTTMLGSPLRYIYNDNWHVKEISLNDTIYQIDKSTLQFQPKYRIHAGKYEVSLDVRADNSMKFFDRLAECVQIRSLYETDKILFFSCSYEKKMYYGYYDKSQKNIRYFDASFDTPKPFVIPNDLDGGPSFWPRRQENNYMYAFYEASELKEMIKTQKKLTPKGSKEAVQAFQKMYQKLDEEDNPVLVIVKLK